MSCFFVFASCCFWHHCQRESSRFGRIDASNSTSWRELMTALGGAAVMPLKQRRRSSATAVVEGQQKTRRRCGVRGRVAFPLWILTLALPKFRAFRLKLNLAIASIDLKYRQSSATALCQASMAESSVALPPVQGRCRCRITRRQVAQSQSRSLADIRQGRRR